MTGEPIPTREDVASTCTHPSCERVPVMYCQWCYKQFCPFHVAKMNITWRARKILVCKTCYIATNRYYSKNNPDKFPPFPQHKEEEMGVKA